MNKDANDYQIILDFLKNPKNRPVFDKFFELCYQHSIGYLNYLKAKGFRIPIETEEQTQVMADLTIDILGSFLRSDKGQPFKVIFNHFQKNEIASYKEADSAELIDQFRSLLLGFIRQELSRIKREADPQIDHLKRRIKDILKQSHYAITNTGNNYMQYVCLASGEVKDRGDCPPLEFNKLLVLVEDAYNMSKNRKEWVNNIFKILDNTADVQNRLKKHELISTMININMKYVEVDGLQPSRLPDTDYQIHKNTIKDAQKQSLLWLKANLLKDFVEKKRISLETSRRFLTATEMYLLDLIHSPDVDLLPAYFREVMLESEHSLYLKDYKYTFETCINKTEEDFRERIKKSIKLNYGDYFMGRRGK